MWHLTGVLEPASPESLPPDRGRSHVQVINCNGSTGTTNGLGNLIVGYNEDYTDTGCKPSPSNCQYRGDGPAESRPGSHNLINGVDHTYSSYAGLIAGQNNTISGMFASVLAGAGNTASDEGASVSGGRFNTASGIWSWVSGGSGTAPSMAAQLDVPVFITNPNVLADAARDGIADLNPDVIIVAGGILAVSDAVAGEAAACDPDCTIDRRFGAGRDQTAADLATIAGDYGFDRPVLQGANQVVGDVHLGGTVHTDAITVQDTGLVAALNADLVDGMHASHFLGATEQAVDSELLDGLDSLELAPFATAASTAGSGTSPTSFEDIPDATVDITVPAGHAAVILILFSAESACYGDFGWCSVRILVDGNEAEPAVGGDFAFDSSDNNNTTSASWESHTVQRVAGPLPAGTYTVTVQRLVTNSGLTFSLDEWLLVAEAKVTSGRF